MTFLRLQKQVFREMRDPLGYSDNEKLTFVKEWLNEGEKVMCAKTEYHLTTDNSTTTVASTQEYSLPTGCSQVIHATYDGDDLDPIDIIDTIEKTTTTGASTNYYIRKDQIGLYPTPSAAQTLKVWYIDIGGGMSDDADTPIIPAECHMGLVYFAALHYAIERNDTRVSTFKTLWEETLGDAITQAVAKEYGEEYPMIGEPVLLYEYNVNTT